MQLKTSPYMITREGYFELNRHITFERKLQSTVINVIFLLAISLMLTWFLRVFIPAKSQDFSTLPLIFFGLYVAYGLYFGPADAWKKQKKIKGFCGPFVFTIDDEGVHSLGELEEYHVKWQKVEGAFEVKSSILIYIDSKIAFIIPKNAFKSTADIKNVIETINSRLKERQIKH